MDAGQQQEFMRTRRIDGLWFNGEFNEHDNLLLNWEGALTYDADADDIAGEPGFENEVLVFAGSQSGIFDEDKTVYMGWTLDKETGLGFVTMEDSEGADEAIRQLDGQEFAGRKLTVNVAKEREQREED